MRPRLDSSPATHRLCDVNKPLTLSGLQPALNKMEIRSRPFPMSYVNGEWVGPREPSEGLGSG